MHIYINQVAHFRYLVFVKIVKDFRVEYDKLPKMFVMKIRNNFTKILNVNIFSNITHISCRNKIF